MTTTTAPPGCVCGGCICEGDPLFFDIPDVERLLGISRSSVYTLIRTKELRSHKVLGSRKVYRTSVRDYLRNRDEATSATKS